MMLSFPVGLEFPDRRTPSTFAVRSEMAGCLDPWDSEYLIPGLESDPLI